MRGETRKQDKEPHNNEEVDVPHFDPEAAADIVEAEVGKELCGKNLSDRRTGSHRVTEGNADLANLLPLLPRARGTAA